MAAPGAGRYRGLRRTAVDAWGESDAVDAFFATLEDPPQLRMLPVSPTPTAYRVKQTIEGGLMKSVKDVEAARRAITATIAEQRAPVLATVPEIAGSEAEVVRQPLPS